MGGWHDIFTRIEAWPLSVWGREDPYAYFVALIFHAWGMALLVGGGIVVCLRAAGVARFAPLSGFRTLLPVMICGIVLAVLSGLVLLVAYPAKALTNPMFAVKFACLIGALWLVPRLWRSADEPARRIALLCLLLWLGAVVAGKLLLHTYHVLTVS